MRPSTLVVVLLAAVTFPRTLHAQEPEEEPPLAWQLYVKPRLDVIVDSHRPNAIQTPYFILPEENTGVSPGRHSDPSFVLHPRLTRVGLSLGPHPVAPDWGIGGKVEIDFQNGGSESRSVMRMRHGYGTVGFRSTTLLFGQTWDVIAPIFPAANMDTLMWAAGNLGDRHPQLRLSYARDLGAVGFSLDLAALQTGAVDGKDLDENGELDGVASGAPGLQARVGVHRDVYGDRRFEIGVWGAHQDEATIAPIPIGDPDGEDHFVTNVVGADLRVPILRVLQLRGEVWAGKNLSDVRGGIRQGVNAATGEEVASVGGWGELALDPDPIWGLAVGFTIDDPDDADLTDDPAVDADARTSNTAFYGVLALRPWDLLKITLDYIYWRTTYLDDAVGDGVDHRFVLAFSSKFSIGS